MGLGESGSRASWPSSRRCVRVDGDAARTAAQPPPEPEPKPKPAEQSDAALTAAKEQFRQGVALIAAGDFEAALDRFLRSRAAFPSGRNTLNAALCLDRLGRFDEALEMYEEVAARFAADLKESRQRGARPGDGDALRTKVSERRGHGERGRDGRRRRRTSRAGRLPLRRPVRVLEGSHRVRVLKDGYATAERVVEAPLGGGVVKVDLSLKPLEHAGQLRVEDPDNAGSEVFIDRVNVGPSPWEGTLGPGAHVVWTAADDRGSAPVQAVVVQGQTAVLRVRSHALGGTTRIEVSPSTGDLSLDGVTLGTGTWEGRLPVGGHAAKADEAGYQAQITRFEAVGGKPR